MSKPKKDRVSGATVYKMDGSDRERDRQVIEHSAMKNILVYLVENIDFKENDIFIKKQLNILKGIKN